jgi:hypothetical protein
MPRKEGYTLAATTAGFRYSHLYPESRHVPSPSQPAVIEMWKLQGGQRLIHFQLKAYVPLNGTANVFDLQSGKRVESGGDLVVYVKSSATPNPTERYDWDVTLQAVGGGLIDSGGIEFEKMFAAPEQGYQAETRFAFRKDERPWATRLNSGFYLKSRFGGCYAKVGFGIMSDIVKNGAVPVILSGYLNPAGSRNLEVDPVLVSESGR